MVLQEPAKIPKSKMAYVLKLLSLFFDNENEIKKPTSQSMGVCLDSEV